MLIHGRRMFTGLEEFGVEDPVIEVSGDQILDIRRRPAEVGRPVPTKSVLVQRALEDGLITLAELDGNVGRLPGKNW